MFAILGGSGLTRFPELEVTHGETIQTPYGLPSAPLRFGRLGATEVVFLARHGEHHEFAPHQINYRANIWALAQFQRWGILAVATVGAIRPEYNPGDLVIPDQVIDYTYGRTASFVDGTDRPVVHIDFTEPFTRSLREQLYCKAKFQLAEAQSATHNFPQANGLEPKVYRGGTYACTQGPRLESAAEIRRLARDGCDLVGMTVMPEAALARELGCAYAVLALVANHAAGIGDSVHTVEFENIAPVLERSMVHVRKVLSAVVSDGAVPSY